MLIVVQPLHFLNATWRVQSSRTRNQVDHSCNTACVLLQLVKLFNHLKKWFHLFSQGERFVVHRILLYLFTSDKEFGCLYQAIDLFLWLCLNELNERIKIRLKFYIF